MDESGSQLPTCTNGRQLKSDGCLSRSRPAAAPPQGAPLAPTNSPALFSPTLLNPGQHTRLQSQRVSSTSPWRVDIPDALSWSSLHHHSRPTDLAVIHIPNLQRLPCHRLKPMKGQQAASQHAAANRRDEPAVATPAATQHGGRASTARSSESCADGADPCSAVDQHGGADTEVAGGTMHGTHACDRKGSDEASARADGQRTVAAPVAIPRRSSGLPVRNTASGGSTHSTSNDDGAVAAASSAGVGEATSPVGGSPGAARRGGCIERAAVAVAGVAAAAAEVRLAVRAHFEGLVADMKRLQVANESLSEKCQAQAEQALAVATFAKDAAAAAYSVDSSDEEELLQALHGLSATLGEVEAELDGLEAQHAQRAAGTGP
eukprot:jgi/Ulvmu1/8903/UM049_0085.1